MKPTLPNSASDVSSSQVHSDGSVATVSTFSTSTVPSTEVGLNPSVAHSPASTNKYLTPTATVPTKSMADKVSSITPGLNQKEARSPISNINYQTSLTKSPNKRIIRKITPIDPKKLQQAGLDRKIAEALSKQKLQQASSSKPSNRILNVRSTSSSSGSSPAAINAFSLSSQNPTRPTSVEASAIPAKTLLTTKTISPPKITITAPETTPEMEESDISGLNSQQRLVHVKNILNKKLLQKKQTVNCDNAIIYKYLKPLTNPKETSSRPAQPQRVFPTAIGSTLRNEPSSARPRIINSAKAVPNESVFPRKELSSTATKVLQKQPAQLYLHLKETEITTPPVKPIKTKKHPKSPQDIARKLDFQIEGDSKAIQKQPIITYSKCLNKELNEIPKAVINAANSKEQTSNNSPASTPKSVQHSKQNIDFAEVHKPSPDFQPECLKQQRDNDNNKIPKAAIKACNNPQQSNKLLESNLPHNCGLIEYNSELDFEDVITVSNVSLIKAGSSLQRSNSLESYPPQDFRLFQRTEQNLTLAEAPYTASHITPNTYHMSKASIKSRCSQQHTITPQSLRTIQHCEQNVSHDISQTSKPSIKSIYVQQQPSTSQSLRHYQQCEQRQNFSDVMTKKVYGASNISQDYQTVYLKQQQISYSKTSNANLHNIPKAAIKSGHYQQQYSNTAHSYKQKIDFPEVSPLKMPFPTVNVPKETPLPTIDSFKKPYPLVNAVYYDLQAHSHGHGHMQTNYETFYTHPATSFVNNNSPLVNFNDAATVSTSTTANSLIVLENKVLSQDEMIDLTELRLSSANAPRFVNPHKPIPEVVIKQETSDEYSAANTPFPSNVEQTLPAVEEPKEIVMPNNETTCDKVVISNKQNMKIIINAQKLKLPPKQLADLAKKIKESTSTNPAKLATNQGNKSGDMHIPNTKAASGRTITPLTAKHTVYVKKEIPAIANNLNKSLEHNKPMYMDTERQDHNHQLNQPLTKGYIVKTSNNNTQNKSAEHGMLPVKEEPKTHNVNVASHTILTQDAMDTPFADYRESAVEIIDEPEETEDCFSAVDFINALSNTNPITEETSLELSPEELNLNASCAMNLSPLRIQSYTPSLRTTSTPVFKPYTPKLDNSSNPESMSTIVIESSKGPETIITNESPNKYGTLQKVKMFSNLGMCDMDLESPLENVEPSGYYKQQLILEPLTEPKNIDLTNVIVATDPDEVKLIISQVNTGNETKNSTNKNNSPGKCWDNSNLRSTIVNTTTKQKKTPLNKSAAPLETVKAVVEHPKDKPVACISLSENIIEETQINDLQASKLQTQPPEPSVTKYYIKTPEKPAKLKSILKSATTAGKQNRGNCKDITTNESVTAKPLQADISTNTTSLAKPCNNAFEAAKSNETSSSTTITSKRISRFKKGKINLVQRNKAAGSAANKPATGEKQNENNKHNLNEPTNIENAAKEIIDEPSKEKIQVQELKQNSDNILKAAIKTQQNPTKSPAKTGQVEKAEEKIELKKACNIMASQIEDQNKALQTNTTNTYYTKYFQHKVDDTHENTQKLDNSASTEANAGKHDFDKTSTAQSTTAMSTKLSNALKSPAKGCIKSLAVDNNEIPKASIKTASTSPQKTLYSPEKYTLPQQDNQIIDLTIVTAEEPQETTTFSDQNLSNKSLENIIQTSEICEISTSNSASKTQTPEQSLQDIVRKLDFEIEVEPRVEQEQKTKETYLTPQEPLQTSNSPQKSLAEMPVKSTELQQTEQEIEVTKTTPVKLTISNVHDLIKTPKNSYLSAIADDVSHYAPQSLQNLTDINAIQDNIENISSGNITPTKLESTNITKTNDLDEVSKVTLKDMRNGKVSLIDIVKHTPLKPTATSPSPSPVIPFKMKTPETNEKTTETKGITTLLKQIKSQQKLKQDQEEQQAGEANNLNTSKAVEEPQTSVKETQRSLPNVSAENQISKILANTSSRRASLVGTPTLQETPNTSATSKSSSSRKILSTRPFISDDDLEFLPVNAEIKFKLSKSKPNESETSLHTTSTSGNSNTNRRTRLLSKPLEMEVSQHSTPLTKRSRYYSQTLETNVTISFDALKSANSPNVLSPLNLKHLKPLDTEESCHDSTQDSNKLVPTKQRKKLRKTLEDIKKSQKSHTDTDSDDENRDDYDDCGLKNGEEGNEFLGFEENAVSSSKNTEHVNQHNNDNNKMGKTKGGTLKNWLTTGKAIAPTLEQDNPTKRIRHDDEIPATSHVQRSSGSGRMKPFKKRWDLSNSRNEETDITDDTSPVDDEEESAAKRIPTIKKSKRGIKNVIDSSKELLESKKIKLDESLEQAIEHSFIKPRHLRTISKNSGTDSESHEEKLTKVQRPRLRTRNLQENLPISTTSKESKETVNDNSAIDSDWHEDKEVILANSENKVANKEKHSENSGIGNDCEDRTESRQAKAKRKAGNSKKSNDLEPKVVAQSLEEDKQSGQTNSDSQEVRGSKRLKSTNINKILDKSLNNLNTDTDCADKTEFKQFKPQEKNQKDNELQVAVTAKNYGHDSELLDAKGSKCLKSEHKAEDIQTSFDKSQESHNTESHSHKGKRSRRLKSKHMTDNDISKSLDNSDKPKNSIKKEKNASTEEKSKMKSSKEHDLETVGKQHDTTADNSTNNNNNSFVAKCKTEKLSPATKTPQNKAATKKPRLSKVKSKEKSETPTMGTDLNDTSATTSVRCKKRSLSSDSSNDDEAPLSTTKKRSSKIPPKRKPIIEDSNGDSTSTPLKKTNENQSTTDDIKPITTPHLAVVKSETAMPTDGRKRKCKLTESNFNSRLLLITRREQLETDEVITETKPGSGSIECGFCLGRTTKWISHLAEHYGVGWQVGQQKLNVENRNVVLNCILNYMKSTSCKGLACRMCKKVYRSGLGILMHIETCGVQVTRVKCENCNRDYAQYSMSYHKRTCYAKSAVKNQSSEPKLEENAEKKEKVVGNTGRVKRNSTIKAESKLKVLGAELEKITDNIKNDKLEIDPKSRIRYRPPLKEDPKWSEDIKKLGKATCPKNRCKFSSSDLKEFCEHIKNCKHIKSGYFCNFCNCLVFETEKEAIEHVIKNHKGGRRARKQSNDSDCILKTDEEESSDDNYLSEEIVENELNEEDSEKEEEENDNDLVDFCEKRSIGYKKQNKKPYSRPYVNQTSSQASRKEVFDGRFSDLNAEVLKKWKSFLKLNYSDEPLYAEFTAQYSVTNQQDFSKYLPKQNVSMKFNFKAKPTLTASLGQPESNIEWSELKRYESIHNSKNTYFFLGAPIKLCCWLPLPAHINEQYLAVVYRQDMFKFIKFTQPRQHHSIILIFKVTQNNQSPKLNIHYGFVVPDGPVHHVAFLPSGGYDETSNRLCLVAVATVTSTIKVYSLPLNVDTKLTTTESSINNDHITLIEVKPSFVLNLDLLDQQQVLCNTQCLQICWSEFSGHQHIFASFSNGFMAIWGINNDPQENLNRFVVDDVANYAPLNYFYIGEKRVKCFAIHYDTNGPRWLAASTVYRKFVILDIKNFTQPIPLKEEVHKNILLSLDWCPLWETLLYSYCDSITNSGRCVTVVNPTNIIFTQTKLDLMLCGVTQVQYTPVSNMCVSALDNGDVVFLDTKELHYFSTLGRKFGERRALYSMDVKNLNGKPLARLPKSNDNNANTNLPIQFSMEEKDYREKYGLIFKPLLKLKDECKGPYLSEQRCPPSNIIPIMRINSLRCNLNLNAKNLIALGYENGFLRLVYFNKDNL